MRKEVIFAIIAGVSIGLIIAFGTWRVSKLVKVTPAPVSNETPSPKIIKDLTLETIKDYDVFNVDPIIKGVTSPNSDVVVITEEKDYYVKSDSVGQFEVRIELPAGLSIVKINNLPAGGAGLKLNLVYSTEVEENLPASEAGLKSYVGTITDISPNAIQVKSNNGNILQISATNETKYINTLKKNVEVKETDLAIGDYIVAMGKTNGNKVLHTSRILITKPVEENKYEFEKMKIEKLTKTSINDITLPKKWFGPNTKDLEVGEDLIIVGIKDEKKNYTLRTIFKLIE